MQDLQQQQDPPEAAQRDQEVKLSAYLVAGGARDLDASGGKGEKAGQLPGFFQVIELAAEYFFAKVDHHGAGSVAAAGIIIEPDMGQVGSDEDHVSFFEGVDPVADDPSSMSFLYEDQLKFWMEMEGGIEGVFVPVDYG